MTNNALLRELKNIGSTAMQGVAAMSGAANRGAEMVTDLALQPYNYFTGNEIRNPFSKTAAQAEDVAKAELATRGVTGQAADNAVLAQQMLAPIPLNQLNKLAQTTVPVVKHVKGVDDLMSIARGTNVSDDSIALAQKAKRIEAANLEARAGTLPEPTVVTVAEEFAASQAAKKAAEEAAKKTTAQAAKTASDSVEDAAVATVEKMEAAIAKLQRSKPRTPEAIAAKETELQRLIDELDAFVATH